MDPAIVELLQQCENNGNAAKYIVNPDSYKFNKGTIFGQTKPVVTDPIKYKSDDEEIFVVSDLHIAAGRNKAGVYQGTENFFADESFERFLIHANKSKKTKNAILIINGDIFDFLRVTDFPGKVKKPRPTRQIKKLMKFKPLNFGNINFEDEAAEYKEWSEELAKVGINKPITELIKSISKKEKKLMD